MRVPAVVSQSLNTRYIWSDPCTPASIASWTLSSPDAITLYSELGTVGCFVPGTKYAYIAPVDSLLGKTIQFEVIVVSSGNALCNFYFGVDANGYGQMLRIDTRGGSYSGLINCNSWTAWDAPSSGPILNTQTLYSIKININKTGLAQWYLDGVFKGSFQMRSLTDSYGRYIAIHGDGGGVGGGIFFMPRIAPFDL